MTYQPTKPLPLDKLNRSVTDLYNNFHIANEIFGINHFPFDDMTSNIGKHKFVTLPSVNNNFPKTGVDEIALFVEGAEDFTQLTLMEENSIGLVGNPRAFSGPILLNQGELKKGGTIPLYGGLILKFVQVTCSEVGKNPFTFTKETGAPFSVIFSYYAIGITAGTVLNSSNDATSDSFNVSVLTSSPGQPPPKLPATAAFFAIGI